MKRILLVLSVVLFAIFAVSAQRASAKRSSNGKVFTETGVKPLTQYALVQVFDDGVGVGFRSNMGALLKSIGFKVMTYRRPSHLDEMDAALRLKATRRGSGGLTVVEYYDGEDRTCTIDFANKGEADNFVKSMQLSGYRLANGIYSHPSNDDGPARIYVRVTGKKVKIMCPFEMLPYNF